MQLLSTCRHSKHYGCSMTTSGRLRAVHTAVGVHGGFRCGRGRPAHVSKARLFPACTSRPTRAGRRDSTFPGRMPGENLGDVSVREFLERAVKTGGKIVNKMGANAQLVLDTVKSAIEEGRKGR